MRVSWVRRLIMVGMLVLSASASGTTASSVRAAQPKPSSEAHGGHAARATPILRRWQNLAVGGPIHALDEAARDPRWLQHALIQRIGIQTGLWHVQIEDGYTVFRIYPYLRESDPKPSRYVGIVLKVKGDLSRGDLIRAIRSQESAIRIDEYDLFGVGKGSHYRHSRPVEAGR